MCNNIFFLRGHFMVRMIFAVMTWELSINQVQLRQKSVLLDLFPSCETTYMHTVYALNDRNAYYQIPLKDREERKKEEWEERKRGWKHEEIWCVGGRESRRIEQESKRVREREREIVLEVCLKGRKREEWKNKESHSKRGRDSTRTEEEKLRTL